MLLNELVDLETIQKSKHSLNPSTYPRKKAGGEKAEEIGAGASGIAYRGEEPNTVNKTSYHAAPDDGYIQFVKAIQKHQNNPFFPRIYNAEINKEGDMYALTMDMEKLVPLKSPKMIKTAPHIFSSLGLDWAKYGDLSDEKEAEWTYNRELWDNEKTVKTMQTNTTNPQFAEAIQVIVPLMKKFGSDLHLANFMVRLTGSGPQLVITDPVQPSMRVRDPLLHWHQKRRESLQKRKPQQKPIRPPIDNDLTPVA